MPEKGVIGLFLREIKWDEYELLKKKIHRDHQDDDEYFSGEHADVEEEEDDNDVGGTKITSFKPFSKPIGSNWFPTHNGSYGGQIWQEFPHTEGRTTAAAGTCRAQLGLQLGPQG
ncbi:hypothetical protein B0H14DRAFT_2590770 [Mycena olivaceomarginata]|nr:hypothetical protein B0H14DRAFT_2590770 [Mycena olivaceomarginata]